MSTELTENQRDEAIKALKQWFQSQDINPSDAGLMMIKLVAEMYTYKTKSIVSLAQAARETHQLLLIEIAGYLR